MSKLENNKKAKRESLLDSAFSLFTSKGITKTSISDIVQQSGVAKGTFYLYFRDKYDIRNMLIAHKASQLFEISMTALQDAENINNVYDEIIFIINNLIDQLTEDKSLLAFISKNLSWGVFKTSLINTNDSNDLDFSEIYYRLINRSDCDFVDPEIMIFMIMELVSSTCYSSILYSEPISIDKLKPYLFSAVKDIISQHITEKE